ncbi:MAG: diacylglycerol kinase family lipid kinase [Bacillota bacterium]|jgi:YegS/Rv2252/BmrU family lipid kinase|nr:MAG: diacylglycerol kinase family lipid kinase [Bacillota bacterium]
MKRLFIVNPVAGGGRGLQSWKTVESALDRAGVPCDHRLTRGRGDATEIAAEGRRAGYDVVVGVGGDGTIQEIVNGLVDSQGDCPSALAVIPGGTGNDFCKMLSYPLNPLGALEVVLNGTVRKFDVGRANGRCFINIAGVGFDAEVAGFLNQRPKRLPGALMYVYGVLVVLFRYRPAPMTLVIDGEAFDQKCLLVSVANGPSHAGGMKMCPDARPDDGTLDLCVVGDVSRLQTVALLPKVFSGRHTAHPSVRIYSGKRVRITSPSRLFLQADGEVFGHVPGDFDILPGALRVVGAAIEGP